MRKFGIDVSAHQGQFNWERAISENGVEFAILKGGGGDAGLYKDSQFERNYAECKSKNLPIGVYWFSKALNVPDAIREAEYFYNNCLKGKKFELPIYIDVENKTQLSIGKRLLTDTIKAWFNYLDKKNYMVGIYSYLSFFNTYVYDNELDKYPHWIAQWSTNFTYKKDCGGLWQFGGEQNFIRSNRVAGQVCDQDYLLVDYPSIIKAAGKNGFNASDASTPLPSSDKEPVVERKSNEEIAKEVVAGKWGNGDVRRNRLAEEGYDYSVIQSIVNNIVNGVNPSSQSSTSTSTVTGRKTNEEIAQEVLDGKWGNGDIRRDRLAKDGYNYAIIQQLVNQLVEKKNTPLNVGDKVKMHPDATVYNSNKKYVSWVYTTPLYVRDIDGNKVLISIYRTGDITGPVDKKYLTRL